MFGKGKFRDAKADAITANETKAVYELTCRFAKENNLTFEQVQECYK